MADVQYTTLYLPDGTGVSVVVGSQLYLTYVASGATTSPPVFGTSTSTSPAAPDVRTPVATVWFHTPFGPQPITAPDIIDEYRRRDYAELTAGQAAAFYASGAEVPDVSYVTGVELPTAMAAVASGNNAFAAAQRAAFVPLWVGAEAVASGVFRLAPDGTVIQRNSSGTTRPAYDATEAALWTVKTGGGSSYTDEQVRDVIGAALAAGTGITVTVNDAGDLITIDATTATLTAKGIVELATTTEALAGTDTVRAVTPVGLKAVADTLVPKWKPNTAYTAGTYVFSPSGRIVSALVDFTSGSTYNPANWATQAALDPLGLGFPVTLDPMLATSTGTLGAANKTNYYRVIGGGDISKIGLQVTTAAGNIAVAVYRSTGIGRNAVPGALVVTSGSVPCPAIGYAEVPLGQTVTVQPGDFLAISADDATAAFRSATTVNLPGDLFKGRALSETAFPAPTTPAATVVLNRSICLIGVP